jgi:hypothetical protein
MLKEALVLYLSYCPYTSLVVLREATGLLEEIRTWTFRRRKRNANH